MAYKRPILKEVVAALSFGDGKITDAQVLTLATLAGSRGFPELETGHEVKISTAGQIADLGRGVEPNLILKCWAADRRSLIQFSKNRVIINQIGEYSGWEEFLQLFRPVVQLLEEKGLKDQVNQISLETIDEFSVSLPARIGDFVNCGGEFVPAYYRGISQSADISLGRGFVERDNSNMALKFQIRYQDSSARFVANSVFRQMIKNGVQIFEVLEQLHETSRSTFEGWITDKTRIEVMGGKK